MIWYLQSLDFEVWRTILCGYTSPTKVVDGNKIQKPLDEFNDEEKKEFKLNSKAMRIFAFAMDRIEFNIICQCKMANEIWRILEITHKGTNQVKEFKVGIIANNDKMKITQQEKEPQEEEASNMCLMALEDRDEVSSNFDD